MKQINTYIIEKLKLNKDSKSEDFKYILFHKDDPYKQWVAGVHKSLPDIGYYLKCHRLPGCHNIWECPTYLVKEFIKKWKESPGNKRYQNVVKYDIWIQRLGVVYGGKPRLSQKIDNGKLDHEIKQLCDDMFEHLHKETGLPIGYIDVVLWKSLQNHLIEV